MAYGDESSRTRDQADASERRRARVMANNPGLTRWETDPEKVNAYLAANADDPKLIAAAQRGTEYLDHELYNRGIRVPEHYKAAMGQDGKVIVKEMSWWDKHKSWALPALGMAGAIAGPAAFSALSGGGGTAAPLASTQIGSGFVPAVGGTAAAGGATAPLAATVGGSLAGGGLPSTLSSTVLPQAMSTLPAAGSTNMGLWSTLGKYALNKGRSMATSEGLDQISGALENYSKGSAANRGTQAELMLDMNSELEQQLLARAKEQRAARSAAYRDSMVGQHAANFMPAQRPGGMAQSYTQGSSPEARATGEELFRQAQARLKLPDLANPQAMPDYRNLSTDPEFGKTRKPGWGERIAGWGSLAAGLASGRK